MGNSFRILDKAINLIAPGNRFTQSKVIEDSIKNVLINKYGAAWKGQNELFFNCYDFLRKDFRKESYSGDVPYFYLMYYMPLNIPKVQLVFIQLMRKKQLPRKLKILDIGSGVGTTTVAIMDLIALLDNLCKLYGEESFFEAVSISALERSKENIAVYKEHINCFTERLKKNSSINKVTVNEPVLADIEKINVQGSYDLIILSNVINEINDYLFKKDLLVKLSENLNAKGDLIIIEPASKNKAQLMNKLKYDICKSTDLSSIAPCGVSEKCGQCWIFQTCDIANSELISYLDKIYEERHTSKYKDAFYNDRLKWAYCILSGSSSHEISSDLSTLPKNVPTKAKVYIVGNRKNNTYKICDGKGNSGILIGEGVELGYFKFGDFLEIDNVTISVSNKYRITILPESHVSPHYSSHESPENKLPIVEAHNLEYLLNRLWGFDQLREGQFEIVKEALKGKDVLGILPTGAGKSICYQLPAILSSGVSLVVSPLKSLIKDQIINLKSIGFEFVDYIDGSKSQEQKRLTLSRFKAGSLKLLYLTPERLQMKDFQLELQKALKNIPVDYFIVDEAHCASEWGHDFRPSYLKIVDVAKVFANANIVAVTATASPKVKEDILNIFHIEEENVITSQSLDRDEISFQVINLPIEASKDKYLKKALEEDIPHALQKEDMKELNSSGSGIIFTIYASPTGTSTIPYGTNYILEKVQEAGIYSYLYHSKLNDSEREEIQDNYKQNKFPLLVSTKGFGMGIDKPNIRYIVHMCYTNSLEAYYQEAGRAGRDRQHAHSIIISRARTRECIESKTDVVEFEPSCINNWNCPYTKEPICDYGRQAKFISDDYPDANTTQKELENFYEHLRQCSNGNNEFPITKYQKAKTYEKYLFYFQKLGIIKDYYTSKYVGEDGVQFGVEVKQDKFVVSSISSLSKNIVDRLQNFKKQKYNMLESIWEYVENNSRCRRQFLLDYFQDTASFGEEGCKFCDIEGISQEKAILANRSLKIERLYNKLQMLIESNDFNHSQVKRLLDDIFEEGEQEGIKVRAMKHLEDYTDNLVALYFRTIITLKREPADAYARSQVIDLIALLLNNSKSETLVSVINDFIEIDENLAMLSLTNNEKLIVNPQDAKSLVDGLKARAIREYVYKLYIDNKLLRLNNTLIRSIKNGFIKD